MMAVDPVQRVLAPRFWAGVIAMPLLAAVFSAVGILGGWLVGGGADRHRPGRVLVARCRAASTSGRDVGNGIVKSVVFGFTVTFIALLQGFEAQPTPEGVVPGHHAHRGDGLAGGAGAGLRADRHDVLDLKECDGRCRTSRQERCVGGPVRADRRGRASCSWPCRPANLLSLSFGDNLRRDGPVRQHRRPEAPGGGQERGRRGRPRRVHHLRRQDLPGARARCSCRSRYAFPKDSSLKILTSGLLGEQYIGLEAGCRREESGRAGDTITADAVRRRAGKPDQPVPLQQGGRAGANSGTAAKKQ